MATTVLVIDDEAPIRLLCRVNLEAEGMEVLEAADGPSGLEKAREETPDVVLLDVMMPGLDGWRVAEELLDDDRTEAIPIIFLTARAELRDRARGAAQGEARRAPRGARAGIEQRGPRAGVAAQPTKSAVTTCAPG
jgi:CheY-like chemotaxis protein